MISWVLNNFEAVKLWKKKFPVRLKVKEESDWFQISSENCKEFVLKKSFMEQLLLMALANTGIFMQNMYIERSQMQYLLCQNLKIYFQLKLKLQSITHFLDRLLSLVFVPGVELKVNKLIG